MSAQISKALLEHFLRAIGSPVQWIKKEESFDPPDVTDAAGAYRLGLCAAAERLLASAMTETKAAARAGLPGGLLNAHTAASLIAEAQALLGLAGIDIDRWEATR